MYKKPRIKTTTILNKTCIQNKNTSCNIIVLWVERWDKSWGDDDVTNSAITSTKTREIAEREKNTLSLSPMYMISSYSHSQYVIERVTTEQWLPWLTWCPHGSMMVLMGLSMQIMQFKPPVVLPSCDIAGCARTDLAATRTLRIWLEQATSNGTWN